MRSLVFAVLALALTARAPAGQPPGPKAKPDPEAILAAWSIVGLEANGKPEPERNYRGNTFTFFKDKKTLQGRAILQERGYQPIDFTYTLDPTKTPKAIDLTLPKGTNEVQGIYKLDGDELVLCLSLGGPRPTEFATRPGGETETFTLRRIKWEKYTAKQFEFTIEMPGKPEERVRKVDTPAGEVTTTFFVVRHDPDRVSYLVSATPLPGRLTGKEAEDALEAARKGLVAEIDKSGKAKVERENLKFERPAGASIGKDLTISFELPDSKERGVMRVRLFILDDKLYALAAAGVEEGARSPSVNRFWNSFRAGDNKKEPPREP